MDLSTDSWLAFQDGRLVAYALVWADAGPGRVDADHYVLPGHHEAADLLLERMEARAHALIERTFAAHFGHVDRPYETWLDHMEGRKLDWSLVWIASLPGHGDAAVLLTRDDRTSTAWVSHIGVAEEVRGRGIGGFLLRHCFAVYAERGRDSVGLGVDTHNETGALALYEAHGMGLHYAVDSWELPLHPQG
ncbi:GNAT family N-acetyltransferase [Streptomyces sp. NPDC056402]|uniref:GNAT family N-acetyltransferase n=1 Tax=Streptomyces sp. NPDC056402 TaxID=3345810 RepID=UPI0035DD38F5